MNLDGLFHFIFLLSSLREAVAKKFVANCVQIRAVGVWTQNGLYLAILVLSCFTKLITYAVNRILICD